MGLKNCDNNGCKYNINSRCYNKKECLHPPLFPVENSKIKNDVSKKKSERRTGLSKEEIKAYELHLKGWSFSRIAKKINCSKNGAWKKVKKAKALYKDLKGVGKANDKPVRHKVKSGVRLHNDCFSLLIHPISFWGEPNIVRLKHTSYLLVKEEGLHIQIFPEKLVVRFLDDIVCSSVDGCVRLANERILEFVRFFNYKGVRFLDGKVCQISRHYALVGNDLARKCVREGEKFLVKDEFDGKNRLVIDYSNGSPEFEAEHPVKSTGDMGVCEAYFDSVINKPHYKPDEVKGIVDNLMADYIKTIRVFDNRMEWMAKNNESHQRVLEKLERAVDRLGK